MEEQAKALEYRKLGLSYAQIAEKLSMNSPQVAWNAVESALRRVLKEPAEAVREIELARLDAMFVPAYMNATKGDLAAISACISIMNRRGRLLGIDMADKTSTPSTTPESIAQAVAIAIAAAASVTGEPEPPKEPE